MFENDTHQKLLSLVPRIDKPIRQELNKKCYNVALRQACGMHSYDLVVGMLREVEALNIDINEQSSNGYTALDWLEKRCLNNQDPEYQQVRQQMKRCGALNQQEIDKPLLICSDEYMVCGDRPQHSVVGCVGLGSGFALIAHDPTHRKTLVANITDFSEVISHKRVILNKELAQICTSETQIVLAGGWKNHDKSSLSYKMLYGVIKAHPYKQIDEKQVFVRGIDQQSVAINVLTGQTMVLPMESYPGGIMQMMEAIDNNPENLILRENTRFFKRRCPNKTNTPPKKKR